MEKKTREKSEIGQEIRETTSFPVVGIGASAGGLDAFKKFFNAMPADSGMAFVLIQHLDPHHESITDELLSRYTAMKVTQVTDRIALEINHVFVIPPNKDLSLKKGVFHLTEQVPRHGLRMTIDFFFRSLAEDQGESALCLILSGTGTDGTLGLMDIKGAGGMVIAQSPESAQFDGMPQSAIRTRLCDYVAAVEEMPKILIDYLQHRHEVKRPKGPATQLPDHLQAVMAVLRARTKYDFSCSSKEL